MDRRTAIALALALLVFVVFSSLQARYAPKRRPATPATTAESLLTTPAPAESGAAPAAAPGTATLAPAAMPPPPPVMERLVSIETPLYLATFSTNGARLVSMQLKRYAAAYGASGFHEHPGLRPHRGDEVPEGDRVVLNGQPAFGIDLGSATAVRSLAGLAYEAAESTDASGAVRALTFTGRDSSGFTIRQTWRVRPDDYALDLAVEMQNLPAQLQLSEYRLTARSWPLLTDANLTQELRSLRGVSLVGTNLHRDLASSVVGKSPKVHDGAARYAGVQTHYFLGLIASTGASGRGAITAGESRALTAEQRREGPADAKPAQDVAVGTLVMPVPGPSDPAQHFLVYFGPSEIDRLSRLGFDLQRAADLGWNWVRPVSQLLLTLLKLIDKVVHNYGLTILLLATLVRLLLHPFNMSSMKSMRAMQRLQPEIERIREKYKNDAQTMNTAIMALYRENKVNPAGGCLPMVMQMPLFVALYAVLFNAIDLRQAPFVGWLHDLSAPDMLFAVAGFPVRLLPVLMALSGFLQSRMTPMDPKQAPTMYLMNFVMLFFFYNLPSGLVLYWTVMNLLTALQQWLVNRGDVPVVVAPATVPATGGRSRRR